MRIGFTIVSVQDADDTDIHALFTCQLNYGAEQGTERESVV